MLGVLSNQPGATGVLIYYWAGFLILFLFILTCHNYFELNTKNKIKSLTLTAILFILLAFFGWDNYFNYCIYPLQQSKLLFLSGILFLVRYLTRKPHFFSYFFLGFTLCTGATLHHTNTIIVYILLLIVLFIILIIKWGLSSKLIFLIIFPILSSLVALYPGKGFVNFGYESQTIKINPAPNISEHKKTKSKIEIIDNQEPEINRKNEINNYLAVFIKNFYKMKLRFKRILTPEIFLIPALILLGGWIVQIPLLNIIFLTLSITSISYILVTSVPKQALVSFYYSGPFYLIYDIYRSMEILSPDKKYVSDQYTSLFLKMTLDLETSPVDPVSELLLFSPIFKPGAEQIAVKLLNLDSSHTLVHNLRYWGLSSKDRLPDDHQTNREKTRIILDLIGDRIDLFSLQKFLSKLQTLLDFKIKNGLNVRKIGILQTKDMDKVEQYLDLQPNSYLVHNDAAVIMLPPISRGDCREMEIDFHGGWLRYYPLSSESVIPEPVLLSGNHVTKKWNKELAGRSTYRVVAGSSADSSLLLYRVYGQGFMGGLGSIKSVTLRRPEFCSE